MASEWKQCTIADLGDVVTGKTPSTKTSEFWDGAIHFVTPKDIQGLKHITNTERRITKAGLQTVKGSVLPPRAVCVSCIGNIGYTAMTTQCCVSNQQINSIIVNGDNDADFVYYLILNLRPFFKNYEGQSTTLSILNKTQFSKITVKVPDKSTQKNIATILSSIDEKIAINTQINDNLLQQAQAIYQNWFVNYTPFGGIMPESWRIGALSDLAKTVICGKTPSTKHPEYYGKDTPFITIPDMHDQVYAVTTKRSLSADGESLQPGKTLPRNSVCVSCIGTAGLVCLVASPSQTNQQINSIVPAATASPYYIYLLAKTLSGTIQNLGSGGSTICNLNKRLFSDIEVLVPSEKSMREFDAIVKPLFEAIYVNQVKNLRLATLRDTLLPKLMSGEIDVSDIQF